MLRPNPIRAQERGSAHDVPQFPHVSRPGIPEQELSRLFRQTISRTSELQTGFYQKATCQVQDVFHPLPERGQCDFEFVQAVVEVLPEPARPNLPLQREIGGGDDPYMHRDGVFRTQRVYFSFLKSPEELRLRRQGEVRNLVEEQASSMGQLETSFLSLVCPGEGPFLVAEEL